MLLGGLALRLWGVRQGLPYAYNTDEADHFVPHAVRMFARRQPEPALLRQPARRSPTCCTSCSRSATAAVRACARAFALHPADVYTLARVAAAVLGTAALWLLYLTGARLFGRAAGLLAAAIEAVAFLPVFYAHLALNDVPTLAPLTLSLLGTAGVLRKGRMRDYVVAGVGLGLACATKYTAGIVVLPLLAAVGGALPATAAPGGGAERCSGSALAAGAAALAAFLLANPYALLDYHAFHARTGAPVDAVRRIAGQAGRPQGRRPRLLPVVARRGAWAGLPALAALGGALVVWRCEPADRLRCSCRRRCCSSCSWACRAATSAAGCCRSFPILCLLAAFALHVSLATLGERRREAQPRRRRTWRSRRVLVAALLAQGLVYSVHSGLVLSRADTRTLTRAWMVANVPAGARIVVEPVAPDEWAREVTPGTATANNAYRWCKYPSLLPRISPSGRSTRSRARNVGIENYERTLAPALIDYYEAQGLLLGRERLDPVGARVRRPRARCRARSPTTARSPAAARSSTAPRPTRAGTGPVAFGFDWSFDYYPLAYERPGPQMTVYRLHGGRCARP